MNNETQTQLQQTNETIKSILKPQSISLEPNDSRAKSTSNTPRKVQFHVKIVEGPFGGRGLTEYSKTPARKSHTKKEFPIWMFGTDSCSDTTLADIDETHNNNSVLDNVNSKKVQHTPIHTKVNAVAMRYQSQMSQNDFQNESESDQMSELYSDMEMKDNSHQNSADEYEDNSDEMKIDNCNKQETDIICSELRHKYVKELENKIRTMESEMDSVRKQLCAKKELISEFQQILSKNTEKQKEILSERVSDQKVINLYQILTCTKIEKSESGENEYKCRIVNRESESMLEYTLSLNDTNAKAMPVLIDYCLLAHKNLGSVLREGLDTKDGAVTFRAKDAPLFFKGLIQQIFV